MNNLEMTNNYYWCINHEKIGVAYAQGSIELTPHMVNPLNSTIEEDFTLNTKLEWWVEYSKLDKIDDEIATHYWDLDCGGDTAEEAINALYELILKKYEEY